MPDDKTKIMNDSQSTQRMPSKEEKKENSPMSGGIKDGSSFQGYEILSSLSKSTGEAEIYLVQKSGKKFVLKHYYPNFSAKYEILDKLKGINHPDIINLYEYGKEEGRFYEIMDFAEGGTLADKTPEGKFKYLPMKEEDVLQVVKETVNAFDFCHSKGIVHRDIKPGNLFYKNADGSDILVGDFGISSEVDLEGGMSKRMTTTSRTEGYAAPEIYSGVIGKEIDYYALGITVYELLTGKNPFAGRNDMHIMRDTIQGRVAEDLITRPEASTFSNRTKKLIQGLLTVKHEKRWGLLEVNRFLSGEDVPVAENLIKEIPAFTFNSKKYTDYVELSLALQEDRESAKKMLYRGNITRWAEGFDNDFAIKIGDIVEDYSKPEQQEFGLIQLLFLLNPDRSCKLASGDSLKTFEELKDKIMHKGENIVKDLMNNKSELYAWLLQNNLKELIIILSELCKLNLSERKFISTLKVALTDGYIQLSENIYLHKISDILSLNENDMETIFKEAVDKDSYFSVWFEVKGDREKYNLWWSNKVDHLIYNFVALLKNELVEYKGLVMNKEDAKKLEHEDIEIRKNKKIEEEREKKEVNDLVEECKNHLRFFPSYPFLNGFLVITLFIAIIGIGTYLLMILNLKVDEFGAYFFILLIFAFLFSLYLPYRSIVKHKIFIEHAITKLRYKGFSDDSISEMTTINLEAVRITKNIEETK